MDIGYYRVIYKLNPHKKPGLAYLKSGREIEKGSIVYVKRISYLKYSVWGEMSGGWICLYMNQSYYVSQEKGEG